MSLFYGWYSGLTKFSGSNEMEPSPASDVEVFQDNPSHLHRLVSEGDVSGVRLVHYSAPSCTSSLWGTPRFLSPSLSCLCLCRDLLLKNASGNASNSIYSILEAQNADGQTALHLACRRGSAELVEAILEYSQANVDVLDKDGDPPLVFALAAGSPECVHALIKRGANVRSRLREGFGPSVAHVCAYHGQPDCMHVGF